MRIFLLILLTLFLSVSFIWCAEVKITASDAQADDNFGESVSISGDYAIVGARLEDEGGTNAGAAYIFNRSGESWLQQAKITASDAQAGDYFGHSVSISGDYAIVGAFLEDTGGSNAGAAYIFYRSGTSWSQQAKITASDAQADDSFGYSVSISGDYAIVGAKTEDEGGSNAGAAYIFYRSGASWSQQAKITASDAEENDELGESVSISGNYAIVGAWHEDSLGTNAGAAYIFHRSGESWSQQTKITASDAQGTDLFGESVYISGDYAIIGARLEDAGSSNAGAAYIFNRSGTNWTQQAKLIASDAQDTDWFGCSVSISDRFAFVGARREDSAAGEAGAVYSYLRNGSTWSEKSKKTASDAEYGDWYGYSVSISGDYAIVGALNEDTGGSNAGAAYIHKSDDLYLPVILSSFTAQFISSTPTLFWTTQSETNNLGWNIYRSETNEISDAFQINSNIILGAGTTTEPTEYTFIDEYEVESGETHWYWLESSEISGITETHGPISLRIPEEGEEPDLPEIPEHYVLFQNYPNPFNPDTIINFNLKEAAHVTIKIFNIKGELIRTLVDDYREPTHYSVVWDVKDEEGNTVGSGMYFYTMKAGKYTNTKKMILMK